MGTDTVENPLSFTEKFPGVTYTTREYKKARKVEIYCNVFGRVRCTTLSFDQIDTARFDIVQATRDRLYRELSQEATRG